MGGAQKTFTPPWVQHHTLSLTPPPTPNTFPILSLLKPHCRLPMLPTLYLTNHFLDVYGNVFGINTFLPDKDRLNETNAESGWGAWALGGRLCEAVGVGRGVLADTVHFERHVLTFFTLQFFVPSSIT